MKKRFCSRKANNFNFTDKYNLWKYRNGIFGGLLPGRAAFKKHFATYVLVNSFLWAVWYFTNRTGYPWPIWPTFGWGLGLALHYVQVYLFSNSDLVKKEYDALKKERGIN